MFSRKKKTHLPPDPHLTGSPHLSINRHKWRKAARIVVIVATVANGVNGGLYAAGIYPLDDELRHILFGIPFLAMVFGMLCIEKAYVAVTPGRGTVTFQSGQRLKVKFRPDRDRPPGTYRAFRKGKPVECAPGTLCAIVVNTAQLHHFLRVGDVEVSVMQLISLGVPIHTGDPLI